MAQHDLVLIVAAAGSCLVGLSTIPAACAVWNRGRLRKSSTSHRQASGELYQDRDGTATEESSKAFSDKIQRCLIGFLALAGLLISLVQPVYSTAVLGPHTRCVELWLHFSAWVGSRRELLHWLHHILLVHLADQILYTSACS